MTTATPAVPHWDGPVWVVPIGGDCAHHGPHQVGTSCPDCAQLRAETTTAPTIRVHTGGTR